MLGLVPGIRAFIILFTTKRGVDGRDNKPGHNVERSARAKRTNPQNWRGPGGVPAEPPYRISQPVSRVL